MKLIRDKIPMLMKQSGVKFEARIADNDEFKDLIVKKMQEEVQELMDDRTLEEAADVYEVFLSLIKLLGQVLHFIEILFLCQVGVYLCAFTVDIVKIVSHLK